MEVTVKRVHKPRLIAAVMALLCVFCLVPATAYAAPTAQFVVGTAQGSPGDDVSVIVSIADNPGHEASILTVHYDTSALVLKSINPKAVLAGKGFVSDVSINDNFGAIDLSVDGITGNGEYVEYVFGIKSTASLGTKVVSVGLKDDSPNNFVDVNAQPLPVSFVPGSVKVVAPPTPKVSVKGVTLDKTTASVVAGNTLQLKATVNPSNATDKSVTWKSSNSSVATVDASGKVTAIKAGTAIITVTSADGGFTASCTVSVTAKNSGGGNNNNQGGGGNNNNQGGGGNNQGGGSNNNNQGGGNQGNNNQGNNNQGGGNNNQGNTGNTGTTGTGSNTPANANNTTGSNANGSNTSSTGSSTTGSTTNATTNNTATSNTGAGTTTIPSGQTPLAGNTSSISPLWWLLLLIPVAVACFLIIFFWRKRRKEEEEDQHRM